MEYDVLFIRGSQAWLMEWTSSQRTTATDWAINSNMIRSRSREWNNRRLLQGHLQTWAWTFQTPVVISSGFYIIFGISISERNVFRLKTLPYSSIIKPSGHGMEEKAIMKAGDGREPFSRWYWRVTDKKPGEQNKNHLKHWPCPSRQNNVCGPRQVRPFQKPTWLIISSSGPH